MAMNKPCLFALKKKKEKKTNQSITHNAIHRLVMENPQKENKHSLWKRLRHQSTSAKQSSIKLVPYYGILLRMDEQQFKCNQNL